MYCKNCGKEIDDKAYVCVYCGVKTDNPIYNGEKNKFCSNCGMAIGEYSDVCPRCGAKVEGRRRSKFSAFALLSFIFSFVTIVLAGAVLAAYGIVKSKGCGDKKGLRYNIAALVYSIIVSIITLSVNLIL